MFLIWCLCFFYYSLPHKDIFVADTVSFTFFSLRFFHKSHRLFYILVIKILHAVMRLISINRRFCQWIASIALRTQQFKNKKSGRREGNHYGSSKSHFSIRSPTHPFHPGEIITWILNTSTVPFNTQREMLEGNGSHTLIWRSTELKLRAHSSFNAFLFSSPLRPWFFSVFSPNCSLVASCDSLIAFHL